MQDAFWIVLLVVVIGGTLVAIGTFFTAPKLYDQIGRGGLSLDDAVSEPMTGAVADRIRDEEIRQMLEARNARRRHRGEPELDVEAEMAALLRPVVDPGLEQEIRDLVEARN